MAFDLILADVHLLDGRGPIDVGIADGRVAAIEHRLENGIREVAGGCLAFPGFVEAHIHLDKALILDRCPICEGTLREAVRLTATAKTAFTIEDVHARASRVVEMAVTRGTTRMRSFVEVDPRVRLRALEALRAVQDDWAWALDLELCAFAQEGITNEPETLALLDEALRHGAASLGGCPYTDPDPVAHVSAVFDLAVRHGVDVDFHADFNLDAENSILPEIARQTRARHYGGRVSVGHVTKLAAMPRARVDALADDLADAGIAVTVLPATDLFLARRDDDGRAPRGLAPARQLAARGVLTTLASNNVQNPFTPFGDAGLLRMAGLFAHAAQLATDADVADAFAMVSGNAARLLRAPYGLTVGGPADIVLLDAVSPAAAVRSGAQVLGAWRQGRRVLRHDRPRLFDGRPPSPRRDGSGGEEPSGLS